eukprot:GEMP01109539.1.p1 GENE.GEMP01109539.1~~GEMP01109539.1.p1  ORF type:complete len:154 (-),score=2.03 GEMP01109539.1:33-494(-)
MSSLLSLSHTLETTQAYIWQAHASFHSEPVLKRLSANCFILCSQATRTVTTISEMRGAQVCNYLVAQGIMDSIGDLVILLLIVDITVTTLLRVNKFVSNSDFKVASHLRCSFTSNIQLIRKFRFKLLFQRPELGGIPSGTTIHHFDLEFSHDG